MINLLNLLAAIALLVWGTHIVRTGVLRVFGESLRGILAKSFSNRASSMLAGLGVTTIVQSSTATCLIVASFVGKGLVTPMPASAATPRLRTLAASTARRFSPNTRRMPVRTMCVPQTSRAIAASRLRR